jgi:hypothetical protein
MPTDKDYNVFKSTVETELGVIKEKLAWHNGIGWGAVGAFTTALILLLTWYLPKELSSYPTKVDLKDQTAPLSAKVDNLATKVDSLSENLNKFMSMRLGGLIPDLEKAKKLPPAKLSASLHQANLLVDAALRSQVPAEPDLLVTSRANLRAIVRDANFPLSVRKEAISTFGHVDTYAAFSKNVLSKVPIVREAPQAKPIKAMFIVSIPLTLAEFTAFDPTHQGIEFVNVLPDFNGNVVVYDVNVNGFKQDLSRVKWLNVNFMNSVIEYNGGPLNLENVSFQGCKFDFGSDDASKKALAAIEKAQDKPVTIVSEFL